jgi:hypothetical protein
MLQKEIYNNIYNKKANSIVNEEKEYKGLNLDGLNNIELTIIKKVIDFLYAYNKNEWEKLDKQGKHDIVMKIIKDLDKYLS